MLDFSDLPYQWFKPKRNALVARIVRWNNRWRQLPRVKRITTVKVSGEHFRGHFRGRRLWGKLPGGVLVVNHPTHADAAITLEAARQVGVWPIYMAAYDVFLRSKLDAWVMQRLGAFSVDREGSDSRSMKQAADTLMRSRHPLTIFPEGNVYLENDCVTPFHDGAAFLALRAQKELLADGDDVVWVVPVSIKTTYLTDVRPILKQQLDALAATLNVDIATATSPLDALRLVGIAAIHRNLKLRGLDVPDTNDLRSQIERAAEQVLKPLEAKLKIEPKSSDSLIDRVRKARRVIHEVRTDADRVADHAAAATWADEAMLAFRIISYSGQYVTEQPTIDRFAETIEKLTEDVCRKMIDPIADRRAMVHFSEPIDLRAYWQDKPKLRVAVAKLTSDLEQAVQAGIDRINETNDSPGTMLWEDW